ncbi:hypothetical protein D3C78_1516150 [compost metagenome]
MVEYYPKLDARGISLLTKHTDYFGYVEAFVEGCKVQKVDILNITEGITFTDWRTTALRE